MAGLSWIYTTNFIIVGLKYSHPSQNTPLSEKSNKVQMRNDYLIEFISFYKII